MDSQATKPKVKYGPEPGSANAMHAGRPHTPGTVVARVLTERKIRMYHLSAALKCSHHTIYTYMSRRNPLPAMRAGLLCRFLAMTPDELIDRKGFLLKDE